MMADNVDYSKMSPSEVDAILVDALFGAAKCEQIIQAHSDNIKALEEKIEKFSNPELVRSDPAYWEKSIQGYKDRAEVSRQHIAETEPLLAGHRVIIASTEAEYASRPWSRFWLTQNANGHMHASTSCTTLYSTTVLAFIPQVSGLTKEELWERIGNVACDICFPDSPFLNTEPKIRLELPERQKLREEREQKRAEAEARKNAKAITNPDGSVLKLTGRYGDKIRTEAEAQRVLLNNLSDAIAVEKGKYVIHNQTMIQERELDNALLVSALAHKRGQTEAETMEEMSKKAMAKYKRDWK